MAQPPGDIAVLNPLIVGVGVIICTIVIHALALRTVLQLLRRLRRLGLAGMGFWQDVTIVVGATLIALSAHLLEIGAWALVFALIGEFPDLASAFYHSAVNYTTLGYGDIVMSASWRLLGALEAADGMLLFGVSTAMIFAVIQRLIQTRLPDLDD